MIDSLQNKQNIQQTPSQTNHNTHLIQWMIDFIPHSHLQVQQITSLTQIYTTNLLYQILSRISPNNFTSTTNLQQIQNQFIQYFYKEFGFYVKSLLNQPNKKQITMIRLMLYSCIYSQQKQKFVQRILKLQKNIQQKLVAEIQNIELQLKQIKSWDKVLEVIKKLQEENNQLKKNLGNVNFQLEDCYDRVIYVQKQLEETKKQRNQFVVEKRKILSQYQLSSFAQYEDLCKKLSDQNEQLLMREKNYIKIIKNLEKQITNLRQGLSYYNQTIHSLTYQYSNLKKNYDDLTRECSSLQQSLVQLNQTNKSSQYQSLLMFQKSKSDKVQTQDQTLNMMGTIKQNQPHHLQILQADIFLNSSSSNFSKRFTLNKSSASNMFRMTKQNVIMNQKIHNCQQELQQLKIKIIQLQTEISKLENKQRFYLKNNRKIQKITDYFKQEYESIIGEKLNFGDPW